MFNFLRQKPSLAKIVMARLHAIAAQSAMIERDSLQWVDGDSLDDTFEKVGANLLRDLTALRRDRSVFGASANADNVTLLRRWHVSGDAPSLLALCVFALDFLGVCLDDNRLNLVIICAVLGEVPNPQPYHNNMHYRKVALQLIRLIHAHNHVVEDEGALSDEEIALLLCAACVHDLGHDGAGNVSNGVHVRARLEQHSYDCAAPYLHAVAFIDDAFMERLGVMLLSTDVSPMNDSDNPVNQMRAAYRYHFLPKDNKVDGLQISDDLALLERDGRLSLLCLLLHESDIATSAGLDYDVTVFETALLREEFCGDQGKPSHVIDFLDYICRRNFLSEAGHALYSSGMSEIYARAEADWKGGNSDYPRSKYSAFMTQGRA